MPIAPPRKRHPYDQWAPDARALDLVGDKWTLLIVRDLMTGARRFVEIQRILPGISTEQLRTRLNRMVADGLLSRQRYREVPPRVDYELTQRARELAPVLAELGRWGYNWTWGAPRPGEEIDVGAMLRLAPGLLAPAAKLRGTLAITVSERSKGRPEVSYLLTARDGRVEVTEGAAPDADARVHGAEPAWISALGPDGSWNGLTVTGDTALAGALLDGLSPAAAREAAASAAIA